MLHLGSTEVREDPIEFGDRSVTLVGRIWFAWLETPWFGFGASYLQPTRVETSGADPESHSIRDHTMLARVATALVLITMTSIRRIRR